MKNKNVWIVAIAFIAFSVLLKILLPFSPTAVQSSVSVAPEVLFHIGDYPVSNTILTTWVVMILLTLFAFFSTRKMQLVPGGLQNVMETIIEAILNFAETIAGPEMARKFFVISATLFMLPLFGNLIGLIPGFGPIGIIHIAEGQKVPDGILILGDAPSFMGEQAAAESGAHTPEATPAESVPILAPFFRAPTTDINLPLVMALVSVIMTQVFGMQVLGVKGYWTKFFNFGRFVTGIVKRKGGDIAMGAIDIFVGILELVSEFAKILAFTFRLFGNIFAGEVVLLIMSFLFALLPLIFYGLELFVAVVQAFVFMVLTLTFMRLATTSHAGGEHH